MFIVVLPILCLVREFILNRTSWTGVEQRSEKFVVFPASVLARVRLSKKMKYAGEHVDAVLTAPRSSRFTSTVNK